MSVAKEVPVKPVRLGQSGLRVSPLCLGTMNFGAGTDLDTARQIADLCFDAGVFFWDTADMYGRGTSERMCAELLKGRRNEIVLATKAWATMSDAPNDRGLSARHHQGGHHPEGLDISGTILARKSVQSVELRNPRPSCLNRKEFGSL